MIFKRNKKYLLHRFLISHIFLFFLILGNKLNLGKIFMVWILTVIIPNVIFSLIKSLSSIEFQNDHIQLIFNKWFFKKDIKSYRYEDLLFTYKQENEGKAWGTRFRIYKKGEEKSLFSVSELDGWYDENIEEIIQELNKIGIEVKTK
ncbi:hypothetical protein SAMN05443663_103275 [Flavobacterium defluvii]|uniref:Uncharacterized protein n=2 Tax=Flavobacterium defluvii TaxID=370979 RepID=A0A1M5L543_9FLAO|nr:hypothetical protein SAMN05443663_103275 [Flavobacterium defluvii]